METVSQPLKIDVYFDYSCPWCYIGFKRCHEVFDGTADYV